MTACSQLRIASLVPSLSETLFSLGLGDHLVARTGYCIHPGEAIKAVPKVGGTKVVNIPKLAALKPSHVLLNRDENTLATLAAIQAFQPEPIILANHPLKPLDNLAVFRELGTTFNASAALAENLCEQFQLAYDAVTQRPWPAQRVLYLIWQDPWMTVASNTYISQTLALYGLQTYPAVLGETVGASRYPVIDDLRTCLEENRIDAVLLSTEPYSFNSNHCATLNAELNVPVHLVNGEYTSWYGSRAIQALPALARWRLSLTDRSNY